MPKLETFQAISTAYTQKMFMILPSNSVIYRTHLYYLQLQLTTTDYNANSSIHTHRP